MGTKKIDALQSAQIVALETDVAELRTKLNLLVTDVQAISVKLNILIGDLNDMNEVIGLGYSWPNTNSYSSPMSHGILESMDIYKDMFQDHYERYWLGFAGQAQNPGETREHPQYTKPVTPSGGGSYSPPSGGWPPLPGTGHAPPALDGTGQAGNTAHDPDAEDADPMHTYTPELERIMTIKGASARRARRLARQTLNRLRK